MALEIPSRMGNFGTLKLTQNFTFDLVRKKLYTLNWGCFPLQRLQGKKETIQICSTTRHGQYFVSQTNKMTTKLDYLCSTQSLV